MSGGGKTTVAQALCADEPRVLVAAPYMKNPYGAMAFADYGSAVAALVAAKPKRFRVSIPCFTPKELGRVCRLAWALAPVRLIVDETAACIPNAAAAPIELRYICQIGRHAGRDEEQEVGLTILGQRPTNLPPFCLAESKEVYVFPLDREDDAEKLVSDLSLPYSDGTRDRVRDAIPRLARFHRLRLSKREDGTGWDVQEGQGT